MRARVHPLRDHAAFGCRVSGICFADLDDRATVEWLRRLLVEQGLILFENVEPTDRMQAAIGAAFGPLKEYAAATGRGEESADRSPVVELAATRATATLVELEGRGLLGWVPWHFDQPYHATTNRARILRPGVIPPSGGLTCLMDGIELYGKLDGDLLRAIEPRSILYTLDRSFDHLRFGRPEGFRVLQMDVSMRKSAELAPRQPRAIHPAVWVRPTGERVLHVSPWMAAGVEGEETVRGDALLEQVSQAITRLGESLAYRHEWREGDMLLWDNCRMLHASTGCDPAYPRSMHRATIDGDYGLGRWES